MSFQDAFFAAPPISRTITAATVLISWPGHLGLFSLYWVAFLSDYVFTIRQLPQLWRLVTAFCITGPQLGLILDPFFFWQYSSKLENGNPRFSQPGAYAVYLFFNAVIILLTGGLLIGGVVLLSPLSMALMYTFAQENPNAQVSFFIVQMPAKYLPYASLVITFILAGPHQTMVQATGILSAHAYEFLDVIWPEHGGGPRLIQVPQFVQKLFALPPGTGQTRSYGTAFGARPGGAGSAPVAQAEAGRGGGWASGSAWNARGAGRRLGGD